MGTEVSICRYNLPVHIALLGNADNPTFSNALIGYRKRNAAKLIPVFTYIGGGVPKSMLDNVGNPESPRKAF